MESLATRRLILIGIGVVGAVFLGWYIAEGSLMLPGLIAALLVCWIAGRATGMRPDALLAGLVIFGYLTGNRGFAQLHVPNVPLLPGEAALFLGLVVTFWYSAMAKTLPIRRDVMNLAILAWLAVATVRVILDVRVHGAMALRDFAMSYYALFFFLAQTWADDERALRWLKGCLLAGLALCAPVFCAFDAWQTFFATTLTVGGIPIVYVKSDVAGGFMAAGALWFAARFARERRWRWMFWSATSLIGLAVSNNRAALVALAVGILWLLILRRWAALRVSAALVAFGLCALVVQAFVTRDPFVTTPLYRAYESVRSIADFSGTARYRVENLADKPDNNQFRLVWWRTVAAETWAGGPWFGLGFGADLAEDFLRTYYGDPDQEFTARSPHNFLLSVFARTGIVGLALVTVIIGMVAVKTRRAGRGGDDDIISLWITGWTILTSACFGVVLEGPMAATVFWTALGLANASVAAGEPEPEQLILSRSASSVAAITR